MSGDIPPPNFLHHRHKAGGIEKKTVSHPLHLPHPGLGIRHEGRRRSEVQLVLDIGPMRLHRLDADSQCIRDMVTVKTLANRLEDPKFTRTETSGDRSQIHQAFRTADIIKRCTDGIADIKIAAWKKCS